MKAYSTDRIEDYCIKKELKKYKGSIRLIVESLARYGLSIHEIKLVYNRAVKELSFKDIVKKQSWTNTQSAAYHYKEALRKLRVGGFKIK